jgi:hypothetical protein
MFSFEALTTVVWVDIVVRGMLDIAIYMENMVASCIFYVKVGTLTHLEQSITYLLTVNQTGIVRLMVQHDFIVSISFVHYPRDNLRQTSADILSLEQCPIYS